jgi:hypothetical protein
MEQLRMLLRNTVSCIEESEIFGGQPNIWQITRFKEFWLNEASNNLRAVSVWGNTFNTIPWAGRSLSVSTQNNPERVAGILSVLRSGIEATLERNNPYQNTVSTWVHCTFEL